MKPSALFPICPHGTMLLLCVKVLSDFCKTGTILLLSAFCFSWRSLVTEYKFCLSIPYYVLLLVHNIHERWAVFHLLLFPRHLEEGKVQTGF